MLWLKRRYVRFLEEERSRLLNEIQGLREYNQKLVERLAGRGDLPSIELPPEPTKEAMDKMLQTTNIFDEIDPDGEPVLTDNRKEQYDEFAN